MVLDSRTTLASAGTGRLRLLFRRAALLPLLLPLLAYAATKFYLHHSVTTALERFQHNLPAHIGFQYQSLDVALDGRVTLESVQLKLPDISTPIQFASLTYSGW